MRGRMAELGRSCVHEDYRSGAVILALLLGATVLLSSLAFSFQHYFEYQLPQPAQTSQ